MHFVQVTCTQYGTLVPCQASSKTQQELPPVDTARTAHVLPFLATGLFWIIKKYRYNVPVYKFLAGPFSVARHLFGLSW